MKLLATMIRFLRVLSLSIGGLLTIAPSLLAIQFSYGVGEPPNNIVEAILYLAITLFGGLFLGGGLLLVGIPNLVVGPQKPIFRWFSGFLLFLAVSILVVFVGFSGTVTEKVSPFVLLLQFAVFYVFIWPAATFQKS